MVAAGRVACGKAKDEMGSFGVFVFGFVRRVARGSFRGLKYHGGTGSDGIVSVGGGR